MAIVSFLAPKQNNIISVNISNYLHGLARPKNNRPTFNWFS